MLIFLADSFKNQKEADFHALKKLFSRVKRRKAKIFLEFFPAG